MGKTKVSNVIDSKEGTSTKNGYRTKSCYANLNFHNHNHFFYLIYSSTIINTYLVKLQMIKKQNR